MTADRFSTVRPLLPGQEPGDKVAAYAASSRSAKQPGAANQPTAPAPRPAPAGAVAASARPAVHAPAARAASLLAAAPAAPVVTAHTLELPGGRLVDLLA